MTDSHATTGTPPTEDQAWRAALASGVGSVLEFYDFFIYSPLAALVFARIFFPAQSSGTGVLLSLGTFAVGFLARPLGGLIAGHLGDRVGRRPVLMASFLLTGTVTFAVGLLPTYEQIGVWAPVMLVSLRFLQGIGLGGEWAGAALLAVEHAPQGRKAFFGSIVSASAPLGVILANGVVALLTTTLTDDQMLTWGWRVPFLISAVLVLFGFVLRLKVEESPAFAQTRAHAKPARTPLRIAVTRYPRSILSVIGVHVGPTMIGFLSGAFLVAYATGTMGISASVALSGNIVGSFVNMLLTPFVGRLADRFGERRLLLTGGFAITLWSLPMAWLLTSHSVAALFCVFIGSSVLQAIMSSPEPSYFAGLFPADVRYSGMSIGYQTATIIGGGVGPLLAQSMVNNADGHPWPVGVQTLATGLVVLAALTRPRTRSRPAEKPKATALTGPPA